MSHTYTHTFVELPVSEAVWNEIAGKLKNTEYGPQILPGDIIDMHGIALVKEKLSEPERETMHLIHTQGQVDLRTWCGRKFFTQNEGDPAPATWVMDDGNCDICIAKKKERMGV